MMEDKRIKERVNKSVNDITDRMSIDKMKNIL
jgi:hypothetical protein